MSSKIAAYKRLKQNKEAVLAQWEKRVKREVPSAANYSRSELRNSLPDLLDTLVTALADRANQKELDASEGPLATSHGKMRADDPSYSLDKVIGEYLIFQQVLFERLEIDGNTIDREERNLISDAIILSIRNAATAFKSTQDRQKAELQNAVDEGNEALKKALEEKSSEANLKDQLLNTIFNRVEDYALFTLNPRGEITSWSEGCQKIKEYSAEDVMGKHYSVLYPPEGRARRDPETHLKIAQSQGRFRGEGLRMRKSGELFLADVFITPMYESGQLVGYFKIVSDLTDRHRLVQEIEVSRARVETLELESELRDQFIQLLSHDLRNPLSAAQMSAELIRRTPCNVTSHGEMAQRSMKHLRRADEMIVNLLDASRIKAGEEFPIKGSEFDLATLVKDVCDEQTSIEGKRFEVDVPDTLWGFWDQNGVKRLLENLVSNASKYGKQDGNITVSLFAVGNRVLIKVHNFGSPIDMEDQKSLFEPFQRTGSARKGPKIGWGLGLTLVRGITAAHSGLVKVRSLPEEGTTFVIDLPKDFRKSASGDSLH